VIADNAVKGYLADARADRNVAAKLTTAWVARKEIVDRYDARAKLAQEQATLSQQTQETRANLRAIEKNKTADQLRAKLTARLTETSTRVDEVSKRIVEIDAKLAELRIQFKELLRDLVVTAPLPPR
jgi:chromosome segregation ATPase